MKFFKKHPSKKSVIDEVLEASKPYEDKIFICPLIEEEVEIIRNKFEKPLPEYFKEFLLKVGLKQDLVWGLCDRVRDFEDLGDFLPSDDYFRFGHNGGEDYWLLKFDEKDTTIYEYEFYNSGEIISMKKTFDELLWEGLESTKERYDVLPSNSVKDWFIEFSVNTSSERFLEKELGKYLNVKIIKEVECVETLPAGAKRYEGEIEIEGKQTTLKKSDSGLYFNWQEPVFEMKENSIAKKIDAALSKCVFKHAMCDMGIMNREGLKNISENG